MKGKKVNDRLQLSEDSIPELITRAEAQSAFAQMAEIEAQRIRQEQAGNSKLAPPKRSVQCRRALSRLWKERTDESADQCSAGSAHRSYERDEQPART